MGIISDAMALPTQNVNGMTLPHNDTMAQMPWQNLYQLRIQAAGNPDAQAAIAPYEHQAYAREQVTQHPAMAPMYAIMPAAYQVAKATGLTGPADNMTTPPSLAQAAAGMKGAGQGLIAGVSNLFK